MKPLFSNASRNLVCARLAALLMGAATLLPACSLWNTNPPPRPTSTKAQAPIPEAPWVPLPMPPVVAPLPEPMPIEPLADVSTQPLPYESTPPAPTPEPVLEPIPEPVPAPAFVPPPARPSPAPTQARIASTDLPKGHFAVQVGVFLVDATAKAISERTAAKLADDLSLRDDDKVVRTIKKNERTYVVVGQATDRNAAEFLAARLRLLLKQDVVIFQR